MSVAKADLAPLPAGITPRLLTRDQAATYLALSPNAFEELVAAGQMPAPIGLVRADAKQMKSKRWDIRALDKALDDLSGVAAESSLDAQRRAAEQRMDELRHGRRGHAIRHAAR